MYPHVPEITETLRKCLALDAVPVFIARRIPFVTFAVLSKCGFIVHQTYNQIFPAADTALADQVQNKKTLGYHDVRVGNAPDARLLKFMTINLPKIAAGSCLLMPRTLVMQAWRDRFGNDNPRMLHRTARIVVPYDWDDEIAASTLSFDQARDNGVLEHFARPLAAQFLVSPVAMRIRLEKLGLLHREVPRQRSLHVNR
jgi:hypothetical protein